jgi:phage terminase large subunit-like protein
MPDLPLSEDAALVLALAGTAIRFADSPESEAEHWLRILRMHGVVGAAMQGLGVGEKPLQAVDNTPRAGGSQRFRRGGENTVAMARTRAAENAVERGSDLVGTVDVLHAVAGLYGSYFEGVLYARGSTFVELSERLSSAPEERSAARHG